MSEPFLEQFMYDLVDDLEASGVECHINRNEVQTRVKVSLPLIMPIYLVLIGSDLYISRKSYVVTGFYSSRSTSDENERDVYKFNLTDPECDPNLFKELIFDFVGSQNKILKFLRKT